MTQAEAVFRSGAAALESGDLVSAGRVFRGMVESDPRIHPAWNALSVVALRLGDPQAAVEYAKRALELDRRNPLYLNNFGVACGELGEYAEAEGAFRRALKLTPVYAEGMFNLGKVLHKQGRGADALRAYERAYAMNAEFPGLRRNLAQLYQQRGRAARGLEVLREARGGIDAELAPTFAECLAEQEGAAAGLAWLRAYVAAHPGEAKMRFALGVALLAAGEWREGWREYAWRTGGAAPELPARLDGKRVLLLEDQGLGDVLFFLRFADELRARGAEVALQCPPALRGVLRDFSCEETNADFSLLAGHLPAALASEATPAAVALRAAPTDLAAYGPPPYLALTWRAGTDVLRRREFGNVMNLLSKEVPLAGLGAALRGWKGTLLALQRNPAPGEVGTLGAAAGAKVHDLSAANADLPAMLGILARVDEYATVSNTNVHLRAGLGKPSRVLVPCPAEWRWMSEGDSPWFPGCTLYRQPHSRDWSAPLARLRKDLVT